jgi:hypothetical protein
MVRQLNVEAARYYSVERPDNLLWDYKEQLIRYCWQGGEVRQVFVTVRTEDAAAATEFGWKPSSVDPFQYLTQSQVLQAWRLRLRLHVSRTSVWAVNPRLVCLGYWNNNRWFVRQLASDSTCLSFIQGNDCGRWESCGWIRGTRWPRCRASPLSYPILTGASSH